MTRKHKKLAINIKLKYLFFAPIWAIRVIRILLKGKSAKSETSAQARATRQKYMLKISQKLLKLHNIDLEVRGFYDYIRSGFGIIVPNHKSAADPISIIASMHNPSEDVVESDKYISFISKKEQNKLVRSALQMLESVLIKRDSLKDSYMGMAKFVELIKNEKIYGCVFAEGTRVKGDELGEFKKGIFKMAKRAYLPIIPCAIYNSQNAFNTSKKGRQKIIVSFLSPIKPQNFITQDDEAIAKMVRSKIENELSKLSDEQVYA